MASHLFSSNQLVSSARRKISNWLGRDSSEDSAIPSRVQQPDLTSECAPQEQSPFFTRLPPEIRHAILLYAFGHRTMHVELATEHPLRRKRRRTSPGVTRDPTQSPFIYVVDNAKPRQMLWRSSACPCNGPRSPPAHNWWHEHWHEPEIDVGLCKDGDTSACESWTGVWPIRHYIGVMGWLLSCRRAYDEGSDVLYRTNKFHIGGRHLQTHLADHITPQRLDQISSVEVALALTEHSGPDNLQPTHTSLLPLLRNLSNLHSLQRLHLSLPCPFLRSEWADGRVYAYHVLETMDGFVRSHGHRIKSVVVQIEESGMTALLQALDLVEASEASSTMPELWRRMDSDDANEASFEMRVASGAVLVRPEASCNSRFQGTGRGYWITSYTDEEMRFLSSIWYS